MRRARYPLRVLLVLLVCVALAAPAGAFAAGEARGPLPVINPFPLLTPVLQPVPERAATLPAGRWALEVGTDYASLFSGAGAGRDAYFTDLEVLRGHLRVRGGIAEGWELWAELPYVYLWEGFLDGVINAYHEAFGFPTGGRDQAGKNEYRFQLIRGGQSVVLSRPGDGGVGDLSLGVKHRFWAADNVVLAAQLLGKFPTGSSKRLAGSGRADFAAVLLGQFALGPAYLHVQGGVVFPGDFRGASGLDLRPYGVMTSAVEYPWKDRCALLLQLQAQSSPFPSFGFSDLDGIALQLVMGIRWDLSPRSEVRFAIAEDLTHRFTPDVTFHLSWAYRF